LNKKAQVLKTHFTMLVCRLANLKLPQQKVPYFYWQIISISGNKAPNLDLLISLQILSNPIPGK